MARRSRKRRSTIRPDLRLLGLGFVGESGPGGTPKEHKPVRQPAPVAADPEHRGLTPQPGVPAGPRNTTYPESEGGFTYSSAEMAAGAAARSRGETGLPKIRPSVHTRGTSQISPILQVLDLLSPGPSVRQIAEAAHTLGVTPKDEPERRRPPAASKLGTQKLTSVRSTPPKLDVRDPLGSKTLGDVTATQLAQAQAKGNLRVSKRGVISTPQGRKARRELVAAKRAFDKGNGIETGLGPNADAFANALAKASRFDPRAIGAWVRAEGGAYENGGEAGRQNWLGVRYPGQQTPFSQTHFQGSPAQAGRETAQWIAGKLGAGTPDEAAPSLQAALSTARGGTAQDFLKALAASGWGTDVSHVAQNLGSVTVNHDPQAAQALQVAKRNARAVGINPTPFNGDVNGGGPGFTIVRADAKGMVDWVESTVGAVEGSPKVERWAARFGLNSVSQPWCANYVSNGLLRRGFAVGELPPNPNYVPSYEEWAREGRNASVATSPKPGDLLAFSGEHIGVYIGNGEMISGNSSDAVSLTDAGSPSMIIRPHYKGGKVKVPDGGVGLPGSSLGSALGSVGGTEAAALGGAATAGPEAGGRAAPPRAQVSVGASVPVSDLLATLGLEPSPEGTLKGINPEGTIARILARKRL